VIKLNYIVFDLEYNQASPLNKRLAITLGTEKPQYLKFEIIQIGAIKIDKNLKYVSNFKMYVKPKFMPTISKHVLEIMGVKERYIKTNSLYFDKAFEDFRNFIGQDDECTFVTWSSNDLEVLRSNLDAWDIYFNTTKYRHIDLQQVVMKKQELELHPSLEKIALEYGINFNSESLHDAYADASITKQLFQKIGVCESNPYVDNIKFKLNRKIKKYKDKILMSEINKVPHCNRCGKFMKTKAKTELYSIQNKDTLNVNKMCYCERCDIYVFKKYEYKYKLRELSINDKPIRSDSNNFIKMKEDVEYLKNVEKIQLLKK
jgi:inhibitor of KinA sporulation pathway (predicted exonuclease)